MQPDLLTDFVESFNAEWQRLDGELKTQAATRHRERLALDRKIANLVNLISDGGASPAILAKLKELEANKQALGARELPLARSPQRSGNGTEMAACYTARLVELTTSFAQGDDPEALEIARSLIDQVIIHPMTDDHPTGIEFIGNLIDLLKAAGLGGPSAQGKSAAPDPVLALFVSSVKEGPGAEPLALYYATVLRNSASFVAAAALSIRSSAPSSAASRSIAAS